VPLDLTPHASAPSVVWATSRGTVHDANGLDPLLEVDA